MAGAAGLGRTERSFRWALAQAVRDGRGALGWTQRELARRTDLSVGMIAAVEAANVNLSMRVAGSVIDELGLTAVLQITAPHLAERRRQREPVHARMVAYVAGRLRRDGWLVHTEVEVGRPPDRRWIDVVAFHPDRLILVILEAKTEIHDLGAIDRQLGRYVRDGWHLGRRFQGQPKLVLGLLVVLETEENEARLRFNRDYLATTFPLRAPAAELLLSGSGHGPVRSTRGLVIVDPVSRARRWLKRAKIDGRRSPARWPDYASCVRDLLRPRPLRKLDGVAESRPGKPRPG